MITEVEKEEEEEEEEQKPVLSKGKHPVKTGPAAFELYFSFPGAPQEQNVLSSTPSAHRLGSIGDRSKPRERRTL